MSTENRYADLQGVLERMQGEFAGSGLVEISFQYISRPGADDPMHDFLTCSAIISEWDEGIYCEADTKTFFYHGELPPAFGARKTTFPVTGDLLTLIPKNVKNALIGVVETGIPESHPFHDQHFLSLESS
jgi:hypothetical protein